MSLNPKFGNAGVNAELDALTALLDGGYLQIYSGTQPATADTAVGAQVCLATLQFGTPAFGAAAAGVAAANAVTPDTDADATGTATWYRCFKAAGHTPGADDGTRVCDGSAGVGTFNLALNSAAIQIHAEVDVDSFSLTVSKG